MSRGGEALRGIGVVITRPQDQIQSMTEALEAAGAKAILFPTIEIRPTDTPVDKEALHLADWIVFTSANAVRYFDAALPEDARICAVGPGTADALAQRNMRADHVPDTYTAAGVLEVLEREARHKGHIRLFLPRGNLASPLLPEGLREAGAQVTEHVCYETRSPKATQEEVKALIEEGPDVITFASSSSAKNFAEMMGKKGLDQLEETAVYASIGPVTTETARKNGLDIQIEATRHDIPGLVEAIVTWRSNA